MVVLRRRRIPIVASLVVDHQGATGRAPSVLWRIAKYLPASGFVALIGWLMQPGAQTRGEPFFSVPIEETALIERLAGHQALPLEASAESNGTRTFTVELRSDAGAALLASEALSLQVVTYSGSGTIVGGEVVFFDAESGLESGRFRAEPNARADNFGFIRFERLGPPAAGDQNNGQRARIELRVKGLQSLGLWTFQTAGKPLSGYLWATATATGSNDFLSVFGSLQLSAPTIALGRAQVVSAVWGFGGHSGIPVLAAIAVAFGIWILGSFLVAAGKAAMAFGGGLLFFAVGLVYAVLTPPFQVADEPDHFLTLLLMIESPAHEAGALLLAQESHAERIRFHPEQPFSARDVGLPLSSGWGPEIAPTISSRSPLAGIVWSALGPVLRAMPTAIALLTTRLAGVVFVAGCVVIALLFIGRLTTSTPSLFLVPFLGVPGAAQIAAGCSNYQYLVGACFLLCSAFGTLLLARGRTATNLPWLVAGAATGLAVSASDNGIFYIGFWAVFLFLWSMHAATLGAERSDSRSFGLWYTAGLLGVGVAVFLVSPGDLALPTMATALLDRLSPGPGDARHFSLLALGVAWVVVFAAIPRLGAWIGGFLRCGVKSGLKAGFVGISALALLFVALSPGWPMPDIQSSTAEPGLAEYCARSVYALLEGFGPGAGDMLVVRTFWGLLGWLDTAIPEVAYNALRYGSALGVLLLLGAGLRWGGLGVPAIALISLAALFVALAAACCLIDYNLHGRYLVGFYLLLLTAALEGYRRVLDRASVAPGAVLATCLAFVMAVQGSSWAAMLGRYF